jgi:hypothetical protein
VNADPTALAPGIGEKLVSASGTTGKPLTRPEWSVVIFMALVALLAYLLSAFWYEPGGEDSWFKPAEGVTVFALFYVLAQAIERLLTPIARLVPTTTPAATTSSATGTSVSGLGGLTTRSMAFKHRAAAVEACANTGAAAATATDEAAAKTAAETEAKNAANWQEALQQTYVNATTVWALGAAFAFAACAWLDVYLLNAIAVDAWDPPRELDLLVTGLAIGGGTVPLHDLIGRIQKKDDRQASNTATSATPGGGQAGIALTPKG